MSEAVRWEFVSTARWAKARGEVACACLPDHSLQQMAARLLADDPAWVKPRIRPVRAVLADYFGDPVGRQYGLPIVVRQARSWVGDARVAPGP